MVMRRLMSFASGFTAAIAIMINAHGEIRVVLAAAAGTTTLLLSILYLIRYCKLPSQIFIKCSSVRGRTRKICPGSGKERPICFSDLPVGFCGEHLNSGGRYEKRDRKNRLIYARAMIILIGFLIGSFWLVMFESLIYVPAIDLSGREAAETFEVLDYPMRSSRSSRIFAKDGGGHKINLRLYDDVDVKPGDRLTVHVRFSLPQAVRDFDFLTYYRAKGIYIDAEQIGEIAVESSGNVSLKYLPAAARKAINEKLDRLFDAIELGFVKALMTGDRSDLPRSAQFALTGAGLSHIISVSGMHVVFLVSMLLFVFKRQKTAATVAVPVMLFFVAMTGSAPSAIRALVMQTILLAAKIAGREEDPVTSLSAAILVLLIINPFCIMDIGLQLSFLATLGMILFSPRLQMKIYSAIPGKRRRNPVIKFLVNALCATISANALTMFPVLWYFGRLSLISPLSNLMSLWMVSLVFYLCTICVVLAFVWLPAAEFIAIPISLGVRYINRIASISARIPYAVLDVKNPFIFIWIIFIAFLSLLCIFNRKNMRLARVAALLAATTFGCSVILSELDMLDGDMTIALLDVGQGQSIVAMSGAYTVMIDCGGNRYPGAGNIAAEYLLNKNRQKIDMIILTHTHSDHINGIKELSENVDIEYAAIPATIASQETANTLAEYGIKVLAVDDNYLIDMAGCSIKVFRPIVKKSNEEETMCVMLSAGEFNALVTGDAAFISERILTEREELPDIELLVAGHHGSRKSTGDVLLDAARPEVAVISSGENSYGHPSEETLGRLKARGIDIYRTDKQGTVEIRVKS